MKNIILVVVAVFVSLSTAMMSVGAGEKVLEVRGPIADLSSDVFVLNTTNFAGFYYDIDKNLGAEQITFRPTFATPTGATLSDQQDANGNRGVVYETTAMPKNFKFKPWGQYDVIGFLGDRYFAAYDPTVTEDVANANESVAFLYSSSKNRNLMTNEQLTKILIDDNIETLIASDLPLLLYEGYELHLKSVNADETQAKVELMKNGKSIDTKMIRPLIAGATMADKTYCYKVDLGDTKQIVILAVHFKSIFHGADKDWATVNGFFQISDTPSQIHVGQQYDKMSIRNVDPTAMNIFMDNKDNQITLSKNKEIILMPNIHIRTADQDGTANYPLRYYVYYNNESTTVLSLPASLKMLLI